MRRFLPRAKSIAQVAARTWVVVGTVLAVLALLEGVARIGFEARDRRKEAEFGRVMAATRPGSSRDIPGCFQRGVLTEDGNAIVADRIASVIRASLRH